MSTPFKIETIEHAGQTVRIDYFYDDTYRGKPWNEYDGNVNIYSKGRAYRVRDNKKPSEVYLQTNSDNVWAYDIREAIDKALAEGWRCEDSEGLTKRQIAEKAVKENVEFWRGLLNEDWFYCGVVCTVLDKDGEETEHTESCWGFETFNDYHETAALEMAHSLANLAEKQKRSQWRAALHEARQRKYWASRDVCTVGV